MTRQKTLAVSGASLVVAVYHGGIALAQQEAPKRGAVGEAADVVGAVVPLLLSMEPAWQIALVTSFGLTASLLLAVWRFSDKDAIQEIGEAWAAMLRARAEAQGAQAKALEAEKASHEARAEAWRAEAEANRVAARRLEETEKALVLQVSPSQQEEPPTTSEEGP